VGEDPVQLLFVLNRADVSLEALNLKQVTECNRKESFPLHSANFYIIR